MEKTELVSTTFKIVLENIVINNKNLAELYREMNKLRDKLEKYEEAFRGDYQRIKIIIEYCDKKYGNGDNKDLEWMGILMMFKNKFINYIENYDGDIYEHFLNIIKVCGIITFIISILIICIFCYQIYSLSI